MTEPGAAPGIPTATGIPAGVRAARSSPRWGAVQGKALETTLQAVLLLLLPRMLGPADFGRLTLGLAIVALGSAAISLGAPTAFARFVPAEPAGRRPGLARSLTLQLAPLRAVQLAGAAGLGLLALVLLPGRLPAVDAALVFLALAVDVVALLGAQVALGTGRTRQWSFRLAVRNAALLVLVPVLFHAAGPGALLLALLLSSLVSFASAGWPGLRLVGRAESGVPVPAGALRYGTVSGVALVLGQLTYQGPVLATGLLAGSVVETGFAALAGSLAAALMLAVREVFTVSLPELTELWQRDRAAAERALRRAGGWAVAAGAGAGIIAVPLLEPLLRLVAGPAFAPAGGALLGVLVLLPLLPIPALGWLGASLRLRPGLGLLISAAGAAAFFVAAAVLVPSGGAGGAGAALVLAVAASSVLGRYLLPESISSRLLLAGLAGALLVLGVAAALGLVA